MEEQPHAQHQQLKELIGVMEKQNVLLAQMLSFMSPIKDFFEAFHLVVKVGAAIATCMAILWGFWQAMKEYIRLHP